MAVRPSDVSLPVVAGYLVIPVTSAEDGVDEETATADGGLMTTDAAVDDSLIATDTAAGAQTHADEVIIIIIIIAEMAVLNVAGYLIEERCRWPVITASSEL